MLTADNKRENGFFDPETGAGKDIEDGWKDCDHPGCRFDRYRQRKGIAGVRKPGIGPNARPVKGVLGVTYYAPDSMGLAVPVLHLCVEHSDDLDGTQLDIC